MIQNENLFIGNENGIHNNRVHLGEMVSLIGLPQRICSSRAVIRRGFSMRMVKKARHVYHHSQTRANQSTGQWKAQPPLSSITLEDRMTQLTGRSKAGYLTFLRSMLQWRPEDRKTARELLDDPWLNDD